MIKLILFSYYHLLGACFKSKISFLDNYEHEIFLSFIRPLSRALFFES
jgi:hypothetical protein